MEKALGAYTDEHIQRYFNDVKEKGLTEHGFPRLTSNIGILIAHGRCKDLLPIFLEMMEFCCKTIPRVKAANDFSVREIICCLWEVERAGVVSSEITTRWRNYLASIEPTSCYTRFATSPTDGVRNWALFTAVSEHFRQKAGLCDSFDFIELQLLQQLQWLDENGMYKDNPKAQAHQPLMYDIVPRALFALLLNEGYHGKYYGEIDNCLKNAGLLTLKMQSPNGEMAFGGRSNQFLHNEPWLAAIFEFEAKRYAKLGDTSLAASFKAATDRALKITEHWLSKYPIRHIKNRYPTETKYGCEGYAYFDKYMITVASNLYGAYRICDDSIPFESSADHEPCVFETTEHFHKLFLKSGGYGLEFDLNADTEYDANGLGRIQREGAPSTVCLACPCPSSPSYKVDIDSPIALSACSAVYFDNKWSFGADQKAKYELTDSGKTDNSVFATLLCHFENGSAVEESYAVSENGVCVSIKGDGEIGFVLPVFSFDGESIPKVSTNDRSLTVFYEGWECRYVTNGAITDTGKLAANRNGHYRAFLAYGNSALNVKIEITKA